MRKHSILHKHYYQVRYIIPQIDSDPLGQLQFAHAMFIVFFEKENIVKFCLLIIIDHLFRTMEYPFF